MIIVIKRTIKYILIKLGLFHLLFPPPKKLNRFDILYEEDKRLSRCPLSPIDIIERRLWIRIHSIEKQLVLNRLPTRKLPDLILEDLRILLEQTEPFDRDVVREGLSAIQEWARHVVSEKPEIVENVAKEVALLAEKYCINLQECNVMSIKEVKASGYFSDLDYEKFIVSRHSVREFKEDIVEEDVILDIIRLATYCPSACNRQPWRVYYSVDPHMLSEMRSLCVDKFVASNIHNFMVITVNKIFFSEIGEIFQSWVNGGIFAQSLITAIHARQLGSCLFQTAKSNAKYNKIKALLNIQEQEDIICMVGFGYIKDRYRYIQTHRKPVASIAIKK